MRSGLVLLAAAVLPLAGLPAQAQQRYQRSSQNYQEQGYVRMTVAGVHGPADLARLRDLVARSTGFNDARVTSIAGDVAEISLSAPRQINTQALSDAVKQAGFQIRSMEVGNGASGGAQFSTGGGFGRSFGIGGGSSGGSAAGGTGGSVYGSASGSASGGGGGSAFGGTSGGGGGTTSGGGGFTGGPVGGTTFQVTRTTVLFASPIRSDQEAAKLRSALLSVSGVREVVAEPVRGQVGVARVTVQSEVSVPLDLLARSAARVNVQLRAQSGGR
jgi:hypothetical protein